MKSIQIINYKHKDKIVHVQGIEAHKERRDNLKNS